MRRATRDRGRWWPLTLLGAACSTPASPPASPTPADPPPAVSAEPPAPDASPTAPPSTVDKAPASPSSAVAAACQAYVDGYCDPEPDATAFEDLAPDAQQRVRAACWSNLADARDDDLQTFRRCVDCNGNCTDARDCLGKRAGAMTLYSHDCPDEDLQ